MSVEATIKTGATTVAASGGDDQVLESLGISGGKNLVRFVGDDNIITRRTLEFSTTTPKISPSAPNGYTQQRASVFMRFPLSLDNGNTTVNTVSITLAVDPETTSSEIEEYCETAAQVLAQSDFAEFWAQLSLA
jgi:hypothetical protein